MKPLTHIFFLDQINLGCIGCEDNLKPITDRKYGTHQEGCFNSKW